MGNVKGALEGMGLDLEELIDEENDPDLGIRYDYDMFRQNIVDGRIQQEGKKTRWIEAEEILAVAYDQIIPGYDTDATNTLRLMMGQ